MIIKHDGRRYHNPCFYSTVKGMYDKWNNIPYNTKTEINGRGPCEPPVTSSQARHS